MGISKLFKLVVNEIVDNIKISLELTQIEPFEGYAIGEDEPPKPLEGDLREVVDPSGLCAWDWPEEYDFDVCENFDVLSQGTVILVVEEIKENKKHNFHSIIKKIQKTTLHKNAFIIIDSNFNKHWVSSESLKWCTAKIS
jgi:hypothetical protein